MKYSSLITAIVFSFGIGIILYAINHEWIIIRMAPARNQTLTHTISKKNASLMYWHLGSWVTETESVLWSNDPTENIQTIITSWLSTMDAEQYSSKKVTAESVISAPNNHLYISFDRHPFAKESSTLDNLYWLEGLLKTLNSNNTGVQFVHFLVHHKPLIDTHIDCTNAWPIDGFLTNTINA